MKLQSMLQRNRGRLLLRAFFVLLIASIGVGLVSAQFTALGYGDQITGSFVEGTPLNLYGFQGNAGDFVVAQVIPLDPSIEPSIGMLNGRQEIAASSSADITSEEANDTTLATVLSESAIYTLLIGTETGALGDYVIRLQGQPTVDGGALTPNSPVDLGFETPAAVAFELAGDPGAAINVSVDLSTTSGLVRVYILNSSGQIVAAGSGGGSLDLTAPASDGTYTVVVVFVSGDATTVTVGASGGAAAASGGGGVTVQPSGSGGAPVTTPEVSGGSGVCTITPANAGGANIRSGPGETFPIVGSFAGGQQLQPNGITANGWYQISAGFVFSGVVVSSGNCQGLPLVQGPAAPQQPGQPAQPTATPTATVQAGQPTATYTYTVAAPSATNTVPVATAPPDSASNGVLRVPLDGTASITDFVSYPGGDFEDRISYDVTGLNPNVAFSGGQATLTLVASCFGTGTQNIQFYADGQGPYSCGQTILTRVVNNDSRTGGARIVAVAGPNTYVQWVITGSAPRVN